jgi:hypothetical protein
VIYNKLASVYNNSIHEPLKSFDVLNHDIYVTSCVRKEAPATFDALPALAVSQGVDYINKHYCQARSGNHHESFDAYCANRPYLLLYNNNLLKCGNRFLSSLAVPKFPDSVKRSSMDKKTESHTNAVPSTAKKKSVAVQLWKNFWWPAMNGTNY